MTRLVNQPSAAPTRKIGVGLIAAVIVAAVQGGAQVVLPQTDLSEIMAALGPWITTAVYFIAGYLTRERAG